MSLSDVVGFGEKGWGVYLLLAAGMTFAVTLVALVIGAVLGAIVASAKMSRSTAARLAGDAYTTVFRGVPELLIIYLFYFGGSGVISAIAGLFGHDGFVGTPPFLAGAVGVGVISGAYQAEVYRGAFLAIAKGEIEAARALGMPRMLRFRRIIVPQIMRFALPGLGNVWQLSLKDSALVSVTGLVEIMRASDVAARSTHQYFLFYIVGGALYLVLTSLSNQVFDRAEAHVGKSFRREPGQA
jgi:octopine/nopaline transport system permease protein